MYYYLPLCTSLPGASSPTALAKPLTRFTGLLTPVILPAVRAFDRAFALFYFVSPLFELVCWYS
jgi:hypothetical protein